MTLEEIFTEWEKDSEIPEYNLTNESLRTSRLHHKYLKLLSSERMRIKKMESDMAILKREKSDFYMGNLDSATLREKGWKPFKLRVLKTDLPSYLDSDQEIINQNFKISIVKEKAEVLDSIIKVIMKRGFDIKNALDNIRFREGAN